MEAAGTPDEALRAVRAQLAEWPEEFAEHRGLARSRQRCGAGGIRRPARGAARQWRSDRGVSRAALRAARAGSAVSAGRKIAAGQRVLRRSRACATTPSLQARLASRRQRKHRRSSRRQRARQPRRLLALRARILHARSRLAAGDGAARRQRQRPRLPLELAARCAQLRRDPGRADRDRQHSRPGR